MPRAKALLLAFAIIGTAGAILLRFQRQFLQIQSLAHDGMLSLPALMTSNWLAFGLGQTLVSASGILPASMIAVMAGATLGFGKGLLLSAASTMLGGWLAFSLSRSVLRHWISRHLRRHPAITRIDEAMTSDGWRTVVLLRVSPVMPFALTSYGLGLTRISQRDFLSSGSLASLPALMGYVAIGALGQQELLTASNGANGWRLLLAAGGIVVVLYAILRIKKVLEYSAVAN